MARRRGGFQDAAITFFGDYKNSQGLALCDFR
jgi:hypothetical protein